LGVTPGAVFMVKAKSLKKVYVGNLKKNNETSEARGEH